MCENDWEDGKVETQYIFVKKMWYVISLKLLQMFVQFITVAVDQNITVSKCSVSM